MLIVESKGDYLKMARSILISIKPRYVADILNHKKTIEVRKSMPNCDLPIDVYIYCTKDSSNGYLYYSFGKTIFHDKYVLIKEHDKRCIIGNGKVVAKFTLNKVSIIHDFVNGLELTEMTNRHTTIMNEEQLLKSCCLTKEELSKYEYSDEQLKKIGNLKGKCMGYMTKQTLDDFEKQLNDLPKQIEGAIEGFMDVLSNDDEE
jgi:hypothetical protein